MTYCCNENGCNSSPVRFSPPPSRSTLIFAVSGLSLLLTFLITTPPTATVRHTNNYPTQTTSKNIVEEPGKGEVKK
ncbi:unnamed protein product [Acanthoscelides obtectus]|uniref:Uncharacterized protein n=1 Tax=Acanthoscelides obtectus TaxID=200917 RepID=A0A9P0PKZ6_ACAOB|nr:unnamed protein product [Acanthoscelides obtectus]CAK1626695.1 hypothetical protein AOBTE_LOCUS4037 [Acanthoscelides obtectus]